MDSNPQTSVSSRSKLIVVTVVAISLLAVLLAQSVAQGDAGGNEPDFVAMNGERVFINNDGSYQIDVPGQGMSRLMSAPGGASFVREGANLPSGDSAGLGAVAANNVHIIEFSTVVLEAYRTELRSLGVVDGSFVPDNALLVIMDSATVPTVQALPYVTSVSAYTSDYRSTLETFNSFAASGFNEYAISTFDGTEASRVPVLEAIALTGGTLRSSNFGSRIVTALLTGPGARQLLEHDRVQFMELIPAPDVDSARERVIGGADFLELSAGYNGSGVTIHLFDKGIFAPHAQFSDQPITVITNDPAALDDDTHGTAMASILTGNGFTNPEARGVAPEADVSFTSYADSADRLAAAQIVTDPNGPHRAVVSVSPWGNGLLPGTNLPNSSGYTTLSQQLDEATFVYDLLTVQSMGNFATTAYRPQASAKNVITVGAIGHLRNLDPSDDTYSPPGLTNLSGTGPIADSRIKPDLHFWNDGTPAALHGPNNPGTDEYFGVGFSGTSAASGAVGGYMALIYEMWADGVFAGTPGLNRDVFDSRPGMATAKALAINTAFEYDFNSIASDKNRYQQGWGRPDVAYASQLAGAGNIPLVIDETDLLSPLGINTYTIDVAASSDCAMRTTMVYTDPAGTPGTFIHRVNDLSLRLISPSGVVYWGNNGLTQGNESTPGGTRNTVDTVENVFLTNPEAGTWTIEVSGDQIVEDSHVETGALDADYALISSGSCVGETPPPVGGVTGSIWRDDNGDGANVGESGITAVTVNVQDAAGNIVGTATTNALGDFTVTGLAPGTYTVVVDTAGLPATVSPTFDTDGLATPGSVVVTIGASSNAVAEFAYQVQTVAVGNRIFVDRDFSGTITAGDTGPTSPVSVDLLNAAGAIVASTTTDADGFYLFDQLTPGQYRVAIPLSETQQGAGGGADGLDSTVGSSTGDTDEDDNGVTVSGIGIRSDLFELSVGGEPVGETLSATTAPTVPDVNANHTIDLGLFPSRD